MRTLLVLLGAVLAMSAAPSAGAQTASGSVSVLYAGSLVTPMEGPIKTALADRAIAFAGEGGGSKMLANLIASGVKNPDVFISVDPQLVRGLGDKVGDAVAFASTSLGVGWTAGSKYAADFDAVASGKRSLLDALSQPGLSIGRTDPRLDPKGAYTVEAVKRLAGAQGAARILGADENPAQTFPEQDLLVRIETGQADIGFFYRTEAVARHLQFVPLPEPASQKITYVIALMRSAPHPAQAATFRDFIVTGSGRAILQSAGLEYFDHPVPLRDFSS